MYVLIHTALTVCYVHCSYPCYDRFITGYYIGSHKFDWVFHFRMLPNYRYTVATGSFKLSITGSMVRKL